MRVRKAIKKIAALSAGVSMVGATMLGAMAADLADYPNMFVSNGQFDGLIVVGDKAAAEDVVGSIDIATSLQYALGQPVSGAAQPGGSSGAISVSGDAVPFSEPNDMLEIHERLGRVKSTLTEFDLAGLQGGTIVTDEGSTDYNQYLRFEDSNNKSKGSLNDTAWIASGAVVFEEDEDDVVGDFLKFNDGDLMFEFELEFEEGAETEVDFQTGTSGIRELRDLEDEEINMLGKVFSIVDTKITNKGKLTIDMLGGDVLDTLEEGETRTYTIDGKEYEVTLVIVSDVLRSAKFSVNGEITDELKDGETDVLRDGTEVGIRDILPNEAEEETGGDIVEFFLGANKVTLVDNNVLGNTIFNQGGVEVHEEDIEDASVRMVGSFTDSPDNNSFELQSIKYRLKADAPKGNVYIPPGHGVREFLDEPEGMLSDDWDIRYEGLSDSGVSVVKFDAGADDSYDLLFTNREGLEYRIPFVDNSRSDHNFFKYGDEDDDLIFTEGILNSTTLGLPISGAENGGTNPLNNTVVKHYVFNGSRNHGLFNVTEVAINISGSIMNHTGTTRAAGVDNCGNWWNIDEDDYFVLTEHGGTSFPQGDETSFTHVLTYESLDSTNKKITLNDEGTGQRELTYTTTSLPNICVKGKATTLVVGGHTYAVYIGNETSGNDVGNANTGIAPIVVDMNADGKVNGREVWVIINGGGILDLGEQGLNNSGLMDTSGVSGTRTGGAGHGTATFRDDTTTSGKTVTRINGSSGSFGFPVTLMTLRSEFDSDGILDSGFSEVLLINVTTNSNQKANIDVIDYNSFRYANESTIPDNISVLKMFSLDEEDLEQGLSTYGVFLEQTDEDDTSDAEDLTIEYPLQQRGADVFVTIGSTSTTRVGPSSGGAVVLNPITVGSAKLASEIAGQETSQNLILVGGPCINVAAATLMGSSSPLCGAASGLSEGEAVVKLFENGDNVAMLVAGWSAADTRRATKVVAEYQDYADKLVGSEVVVTGTSLSDINVRAPAPAASAE
jgi:hypothetical protein